MSAFRMLVLGGDGVGPEVTEQAVRVGNARHRRLERLRTNLIT